jgi:hypothetical protein
VPAGAAFHGFLPERFPVSHRAVEPLRRRAAYICLGLKFLVEVAPRGGRIIYPRARKNPKGTSFIRDKDISLGILHLQSIE